VSFASFNKFRLLTYHGSAARYSRYGGKCYKFPVAFFISFQAEKEFENRLKFDKVIAINTLDVFFIHSVHVVL